MLSSSSDNNNLGWKKSKKRKTINRYQPWNLDFFPHSSSPQLFGESFKHFCVESIFLLRPLQGDCSDAVAVTSHHLAGHCAAFEISLTKKFALKRTSGQAAECPLSQTDVLSILLYLVSHFVVVVFICITSVLAITFALLFSLIGNETGGQGAVYHVQWAGTYFFK